MALSYMISNQQNLHGQFLFVAVVLFRVFFFTLAEISGPLMNVSNTSTLDSEAKVQIKLCTSLVCSKPCKFISVKKC